MEVDNTYSVDEIKSFGLHEKRELRKNAKAFMKDNMIYFFEEVDSEHLRLYTVIHKKSFFL